MRVLCFFTSIFLFFPLCSVPRFSDFENSLFFPLTLHTPHKPCPPLFLSRRFLLPSGIFFFCISPRFHILLPSKKNADLDVLPLARKVLVPQLFFSELRTLRFACFMILRPFVCRFTLFLRSPPSHLFFWTQPVWVLSLRFLVPLFLFPSY